MLQLIGHQGSVHALAFHPDGQTLFSAGKDGIVRAWNLARGSESATLVGHAGPVLCLALHSDGQTLASGGADGVPRLWNLPNASVKLHLEAQLAAISGVGWLPNKDTLLVATGERLRPEKLGELKPYHFGPQPPPNLHHRDANGVWSLAVSPGGPTIAWGGGSRGVWAWNVTQQAPKLFRQNCPSLAVALSPDGKMLAAAADRSVRLWDVARGRELATLEGHKGLVGALAFAPDGRTLATAGRDRIVRFWTVAEGMSSPRRTYEWPAGAIYALAFSTDGLLAAVAGDAGTIVVWDVDS